LGTIAGAFVGFHAAVAAYAAIGRAWPDTPAGRSGGPAGDADPFGSERRSGRRPATTAPP